MASEPSDESSKKRSVPPTKVVVKRGPPPPAEAGTEDADALMATTLRAMEWAKKRRGQLIAIVATLAVVGAATGGFLAYRVSREAKASALLAAGVDAELGPISDGKEDPELTKRIRFYKSDEDRDSVALASYDEAKKKFGDTGAGILARMGEAGVHLDRREWDEALTAYADVKTSSLAAADPNVRMRCIEGTGFAFEGKGQIDEARKSFEELSNLDIKGAKPLGLYHLARLDYGKGDKDAAINKLKSAREAILAPGAPAAKYLKDAVEKLLGKLDPTAIPKPPPGGGMQGLSGLGKGAGKLTQEQIEELIKQSGGGSPGSPALPRAPQGAP